MAPAAPPAPPALPATEDANPLLGDEAAIAAGERIYRSACVGCHLAGAGAGENVFRSRLTHRRFFEVVADGVEANNMPAFGEVLSADEIRQVHAYLMSRDRP